MTRTYSLAALLVAAMIAGGCQVSSMNDWFNSSRKWDRQSTSDHLKEAQRLERDGNFERAEQEYAAALRKSPGSVDAQLGLTELQRRRQLARTGSQPQTRPVSPAVSNSVATAATSSRGAEYERWRLETFRTGATSPRKSSQIAAVSYEANAESRPESRAIPDWAGPQSSDSAVTVDQDRTMQKHFPHEYQAPVRPQPAAKATVATGDLPLIVPGVRKVNPTPVANVNAALASKNIVKDGPGLELTNPQALQPESVEILPIPNDFAALQARLIAQPHDPEAIQAVIVHLGEPDRAQRWLAASLLEQLAFYGPTELVKKQLEGALQSAPDPVRVQVALLLGSLGPVAQSTLPVLQQAAHDSNADVRSAAADAIGKLTP